MTDKFYDRKLKRYFDAHYKEYDETAEWYVNPAPNQWKFDIPGKTVILTCADDGKVTEEIRCH